MIPQPKTPAAKAARITAVLLVTWMVTGLGVLALYELASQLDREELAGARREPPDPVSVASAN